MADRHYKTPHRRTRGQYPRPPSRRLWFLLGLLVGVLLGALPYLYPYLPLGVQSAVERVAATADGEDAKAPGKPRFEFYTMLPKMEVAIPEAALGKERAAPAGAADAQAPSAPAPRDAYVLQVGAFKRAEDADRHKARLALLGFEASIQPVVIDGKNTWHRVRLGPYNDVDELNEQRARLRENDVDSMVVKTSF